MYRHLAEFLTLAEDAGELVRVQAGVDAAYESSLLCRKITYAAGDSPILYCEDIPGSEFPLVANLLGSSARVLRAAQCSNSGEGFERILSYFRPQPKTASWMELVQKISLFQPAQQSCFNKVKQGACQQVLRLGRDVDLKIFPQVKHAAEETLPVISRAIVQVQSADQTLKLSRQFSVSILNEKQVAVHFEEDRETHELVQRAIKSGQQLAVVILLGGDPAIEVAHFGRSPATLDPMLLTSLFCRQMIDVVQCRTLPLHVPVETEIVLEGMIDPRLEQVEVPGCVLSHQHLSPVSTQPVVMIQAMTHRANPIYPDLVRGVMRGEEYFLAKFWEQIMLQFLQMIHPEITAISFPVYGTPDQLLFISIDKRKPHHARQIASFLWSWEFPLVPRTIITVDADIPVENDQVVWQTVSQQVDYERDLITCPAAAEFSHSIPANGSSTVRLAIDATRKLPAEGYPGTWPQKASFSDTAAERVQQIMSSMKQG